MNSRKCGFAISCLGKWRNQGYKQGSQGWQLVRKGGYLFHSNHICFMCIYNVPLFCFIFVFMCVCLCVSVLLQ